MVKSKWPGSQLSVFPELSSSGFFCKYREMGNNTGQHRKSTGKSKRLMSGKVFFYIPKILVPSTKYLCAGVLLLKRISCSSSPHRISQQQWLGVQGLAAGRLKLTGKLWWAFESPASGQGCPKARQPPLPGTRRAALQSCSWCSIPLANTKSPRWWQPVLQLLG